MGGLISQYNPYNNWWKVMVKFNEKNHTYYNDPDKMIVKLYKEYDSCSDLAYLLNVRYDLMRRKLIELGHRRPAFTVENNLSRKRKKYNKEHKENHTDNKKFLEMLYTHFQSSRKAGSAIGISMKTFTNYLDYYDIQKKGRGGAQKRKCYRNGVQALAREGKTNKEIARILGCSKYTAENYMREIGLLPSGKPRKEKGK